MADLKREASSEASAIKILFDEAIGDINTRFRETISDLVRDAASARRRAERRSDPSPF